LKISRNQVFTYTILLLFLNSCVAVPKVDDSQKPKCELATKKLTLETNVGNVDNLGGGDPRGLVIVLAGAGIVYSVSAIVSGSIMLTGNTINWIEQEGTCEDGVIKKAIDNLSNSLSSLAGWFVTSRHDILNWLTLKNANKTDEPN